MNRDVSVINAIGWQYLEIYQREGMVMSGKSMSSQWRLSRLQTDPVSAARIAPAKITPCPGLTEDDVRALLAAAVRASKMAQIRIEVLDGKTESQREKAWTEGPEQEWFFDYERRKFRKLKIVFARITDILSDQRLKVICDPDFGSSGQAAPCIRRIRLGSPWILKPDKYRIEKIQVFIHEATHIAGQSVIDEDRWYGESAAIYGCFHFPSADEGDA